MMLSNGKVAKMPDKLTDAEVKKAFKVLESWLWCNYHNATDTDKERAELYKAVQTIFNAKKIPEMFTLAKAEAYKECIEKVKTKARLVCTGHGEAGFVVDVFDIDNLLNELVCEDNESKA